MNLLELMEQTQNAIRHAIECDENPKDIEVSLQIDVLEDYEAADCIFTQGNVEMHYDNNLSASGCVLTGVYHSTK